MKNAIAIFDIGKTNKKLLVFDSSGNILEEYQEKLKETKDDDGFPCEDIFLLSQWLLERWKNIINNPQFNITAVNFTSYGASMVHLDTNDKPITPLYSYSKPYPTSLAKKLYRQYSGQNNFALDTASPPLGMLNSGLQLLMIKKEKSEFFKKIKTSLHLPQYLSFLISKKKHTDFTSLGCHTALWCYKKQDYHPWVYKENMNALFPPIINEPVTDKLSVNGKKIIIGSGLHDSSSSLLPYLKKFNEPFTLISTGTWCINLNPFNETPLSPDEFSKDCLCYMTPSGQSVKASRVFIGAEHEHQVKRIAKHFGTDEKFYLSLVYNEEELKKNLDNFSLSKTLIPFCMQGTGPFSLKKQKEEWNLSQFSSFQEAYYQLMFDLSCWVKYSFMLIDASEKGKIFIDGGFLSNLIFMNLMASHFPKREVMASLLPQATALGALITIGEQIEMKEWKFKKYSSSSCYHELKKYFRAFVNHHQSNDLP